MKQAFLYFFLLLFSMLCFPIYESSIAVSKQAGGKSSAFLALVQEKSHLISQSVKIIKISDGTPLFQLNADKLQVPASVSKLITSAAALVKFGPTKTFTTRFYRRGSMENGVIKGDLVAVGDGDPYLVSELLWQFSADLKHMGIREIKGDLIIDNSLFDGVTRDNSRKEGIASSTHAYDAPVSAFGVNFNTLAIALAPSTQVGEKAIISLDPYMLDGVDIVNKTSTSSRETNQGVKIARMSLHNGAQKLVASGRVSQGDGLQKIYRSVNDHVLTSGEYVRAFLKAENITIKGNVRSGLRKKNDELVYELNSYPLSRIIEGLNQYSNNYIADVLVKRMGAEFFPLKSQSHAKKQLGSYQNGVSVIETFLRNDVGIKSRFVLQNGSGLSIKNRFNADQLCQLLKYMAERMDVFPEFLSSLPASGLTGTLKKRFLDKSYKDLIGKIRAKTGTLQEPISVSSLAGYVNHPIHGLLAFAIIQNGISGKKQPSIDELRRQQDKQVSAILKLF
ncbi:MAG: D-alanyl-D-alanine carboxypeptidase/D-alanyl-D-alanine-endopeptidase [Bdellovibrionota bacterium]